MKIYNKKGAKNYKENKLVEGIREAVQRKINENPDFANQFEPANNFAELQEMYDKYVVTDAEYQEVESSDKYEEHKNFKKGMAESIEKNNDYESDKLENDDFIDPLNREEPLVRDYVTEEDLSAPSNANISTAPNNFDEPLTFKESFEMPSGNSNPNINTGENKQQQQNTRKQKQDAPQPINPNWDEMGSAKKRRNTKKFAKYIVEVVCMLTEKGFVWYANKDINEAKLAEYEMNGEMDLSILLTLENNQQITIKQFFQSQCASAEQLSKVSEEEKADLTEALAEVLMEKGLAPTPSQELMLIAGKILGEKVISLIALKSQTNSLLNQLREMNQRSGGSGNYSEPVNQTPPPQPPPQQEEQVNNEVVNQQEQVYNEPVEQNVPEYSQEGNAIDLEEGNFDSLSPIIDNPINTLE